MTDQRTPDDAENGAQTDGRTDGAKPRDDTAPSPQEESGAGYGNNAGPQGGE